MTDHELNLITSMIEGLKTDFAKLEKTTALTLRKIEERLEKYIEDHPKTCFFLTWQKGRWRKAGRILAICGILLASPAFMLGLIEIIKLIPK